MEVERFTVSYAKTNENFQFQFPSDERIDTDSTFYGLLCVLKNLLQRGNPVRPSVYLQKTIKTPPQDELHPCIIMDDSIPVWDNVIKGGLISNPALDFYNKIPLYFGDEYPFLQRLTIPEAKLTDIISDAENDFIGQQVDFYIPAAKLVIEIDGLQHQDVIQKQKDKKRDDYLRQQGIVVHRISVTAFSPANQNDLTRHVNAIKSRLKYYKDTLTGVLNKKDIEFNPSYYRVIPEINKMKI